MRIFQGENIREVSYPCSCACLNLQQSQHLSHLARPLSGGTRRKELRMKESATSRNNVSRANVSGPSFWDGGTRGSSAGRGIPTCLMEELRESFNVADVDRDGYLNANELKTFMNLRKTPISNYCCRKILRVADPTGCGGASFDDLIEILLRNGGGGGGVEGGREGYPSGGGRDIWREGGERGKLGRKASPYPTISFDRIVNYFEDIAKTEREVRGLRVGRKMGEGEKEGRRYVSGWEEERKDKYDFSERLDFAGKAGEFWQERGRKSRLEGQVAPEPSSKENVTKFAEVKAAWEDRVGEEDNFWRDRFVEECSSESDPQSGSCGSDDFDDSLIENQTGSRDGGLQEDKSQVWSGGGGEDSRAEDGKVGDQEDEGYYNGGEEECVRVGKIPRIPPLPRAFARMRIETSAMIFPPTGQSIARNLELMKELKEKALSMRIRVLEKQARESCGGKREDACYWPLSKKRVSNSAVNLKEGRSACVVASKTKSFVH